MQRITKDKIYELLYSYVEEDDGMMVFCNDSDLMSIFVYHHDLKEWVRLYTDTDLKYSMFENIDNSEDLKRINNYSFPSTQSIIDYVKLDKQTDKEYSINDYYKSPYIYNILEKKHNSNVSDDKNNDLSVFTNKQFKEYFILVF